MSLDVGRAEWALFRRMAMACAAAEATGMANCRAWRHAGLMAVSTADPALGFLCTVSGVTEENVGAVGDLVHSDVWGGARPTVLVSADVAETALLAAGLVRGDDRMLAYAPPQQTASTGAGLDVVETGDDDTFLDVLLAGYETGGAVAAFISAEHRNPLVRRYLAMDGDTPVAAAAMTTHEDVIVFGGASTPRRHRGRGAQSLLLRHRLGVAATEGRTLVVATARPGSTSAANLRRAGFTIRPRQTWVSAL